MQEASVRALIVSQLVYLQEDSALRPLHYPHPRLRTCSTATSPLQCQQNVVHDYFARHTSRADRALLVLISFIQYNVNYISSYLLFAILLYKFLLYAEIF